MPRGRRKQTVESNEEYLSEDHVGQKKLQKTLAHESDSEMEEESFAVGGHDQSGEVSEMEPNSKNPTDMEADIEVEDEGKKERLTNEQKNKEDILKQVKRRFLYPACMEKWVLKTIGERWRQHKSNLKSIYYDAHKGLEANYNNVPPGVIADQWIALVNHWVTTKAKREKDPEKKYPHRAILYIHTHKANPTKNTNPHVNDLQELLAEHPEFADTSQGKIAWNGDALNKILGEEKPGHVHGLGLVPNPNKVLDGTTSRRLNQLHVTSLDPTASEDVLSLKLQMEKLVNHVHKQDATIQELQQKSVLFEQHQSVHVKLLNSISQSVHTVGLCVTSNPFGYLFAMTGMFGRSSSESISNVFKT
ncbi:hypothetical protein ZEAMMB73_Zm00001d004092 [Zea mays]|uniref:Transposase, Ptta/En/Spm, plant n=1 Tax=Zea mays TaxID=4577 RepID=A0A1D6EDE8_MAIZE|nr:hypothetical protein ZEAMMB73_Zm00001d004092 [Zea mays]